MPITIAINAENGIQAATELRNFIGFLQVNASIPAATTAVGVKQAEPNPEPVAEEKKVEAKPTAKKAAPKEKVKAEASKFTLQEAIDRGVKVFGDGSDSAQVEKLVALNTSFGVARVRELPPEKIDVYIEEFDKIFPQEEPAAETSGSMFD